MSGEIIDEDGYVHERGWDGQYRPKQGLFGPKRETDIFGNPKIERDLLGNPKAERNWYGGQRTSSSGQPLFQGGGSDLGPWGGVIMLVVVLTIGIFIAAIWLASKIIRLCIRYPKVMLPIVGVVTIVGILIALTSNPPSSPSGYGYSTASQNSTSSSSSAQSQSSSSSSSSASTQSQSSDQGTSSTQPQGEAAIPAQVQSSVQGASSTIAVVKVQADQDWQSTGLVATAGDTVIIKRLSGRWSPWPDSHFDGGGCLESSCPPGGTTYPSICCIAHAGLIGRIEGGDQFGVGNKRRFQAPKSGMIDLRINDQVTGDNSGALIVRVEVWKAGTAPSLARANSSGARPVVAATQHIPKSELRHPTATQQRAPLGVSWVDMRPLGFTGTYLRARPAGTGKVLRLIPNGARLRMLAAAQQSSNSGQWYRVRYKGVIGYVRGTALRRYVLRPSVVVHVDAVAAGFTGVNLRPRPSLKAPLIEVIPNGAVLRVVRVIVGRDGQNWSRVRYHGHAGYVHSYLLNPHKPAPWVPLYVAAASQGFIGVNLRSRPGMHAPVLLLIRNGARLAASRVVVGADGENWSWVRYHGHVGFAHSALLRPRLR